MASWKHRGRMLVLIGVAAVEPQAFEPGLAAGFGKNGQNRLPASWMVGDAGLEPAAFCV